MTASEVPASAWQMTQPTLKTLALILDISLGPLSTQVFKQISSLL